MSGASMSGVIPAPAITSGASELDTKAKELRDLVGRQIDLRTNHRITGAARTVGDTSPGTTRLDGS
jgi:hypothetical protein